MQTMFKGWLTSRCTSIVIAAAVVLGSISTLVGWLVDSALLKALLPGRVAMNPMTAVALLVAGISLGLHAWGHFRRLSLAGAVAVGGIGAECVACYWAGVNLGVDRVLFSSALGNNCMAPNTGFCLFLAGAGLGALCYDRVHRLVDAFASVLACWSFVSLVGYAFGSHSLYGIGGYIPMAMNTALLLHLLGLGLLLADSRSWLAWIIDTNAPWTALARRLVPTAVAAPLVCGWLQLQGQVSGLYDAEFGAALVVVATIAVLVSVIVWAVKSIDRALVKSAAMRATLQEREIQYRVLIEGIQDYAIFLLDPTGNVSSWNEGAQRITGYHREQIVGGHFSTFYSAEDRACDKPDRELLEAARQGLIRDEGWRIRRDGSTFWAATLITAIFDDAGKLTGFSKITRDMTAQREYELKLSKMNDMLEKRVEERTRELTEANRDLAEQNRENETFVYSVSHDLRSPLVNLQGFSTELEQSCTDLADSLNSPDVPEEVRRHAARIMDLGMQEPIHFIRTAVTRLSAIIDALLRLSRAGRVEYQVREVDLNDVVRRIVDSMRVTLAQRRAELMLHPLPAARGDATALEQVFANLIGNALNYLDSTRPGKIEIGVVDELAAKDGSGPPQRTFFVRDNGQGIAAGYQAKVFQAFQRLHPLSAPGEGMGLTIVRRVVERHGGRIWLESTEGQGTTFFVSLPATIEEKSAAICPASSAEQVSERTRYRMDAHPQEELCHAY